MFKRKKINKLISVMVMFFILMSNLAPIAMAESTGQEQPIQLEGAQLPQTDSPSVTIEKNVTGRLFKGETAVANVTFSFHSTGEHVTWYDITTDESGNFWATVPDGSYIIEGIWLEKEAKWYPILHEFEVEGSTRLDLNLQPGNVMGQIMNDTVPVGGVLLNVYSVNAPEVTWYHATTNKNGQYYLNLPDGDYKLDGLWVESEKKWYDRPTAFKVANGILQGQEQLSYNLAETKRFGRLTKGDTPLAHVPFSVHSTDGANRWYDTKTDEAGEFSFNLPDGGYQLEGVWLTDEAKWYELKLPFNVVNSLPDNGGFLEINLQPKANGNVTGKLLNGNQSLPNIWFSAHTVSGDVKWFDANTNQDGEFSFNLVDGKYQIDGIWLPSEAKWYVLNKQFTVVDGKLAEINSLELQVHPTSQYNVKGVVLTGTTPVGGVEVNAHTISGEQKWYNAKTDQNGEFVLDLPDGSYQIDGIWISSEAKWYELQIKFDVQNGQLVGLTSLNLNLHQETIPNYNVLGQLTKGTTPIENVWISAHTTAGEVKWFNSQTDSEGKFAFELPDGRYQMDGVWLDSESRWYDRTISFSVANGVLVGTPSLQIDLEKNTDKITGSIIKGSEKVANVSFSFHSVGENVIWYDSTTDGEGSFGVENLPDGTYIVEGVWMETEGKWYELQYSFEVLNGKVQGELVIDLLAEQNLNVKGVVSDSNGPLADVLLTIRYEGNDDIGIPVFTDNKGKFATTLADGKYVVSHLYYKDIKSTSKISISFEVKDGKLYVDDSLTASMKVIAPDISLFGELERDGAPVADATLYIKKDDHTSMLAITDQMGKFTLRLQDGTYLVDFIILEDGTWVETDITFTVKNGTTNGDLAITLDPTHKVSGKIVDVNGFLENVEVFLTKKDYTIAQAAITNEQGEFQFQLPNGDYLIYRMGNDEKGYINLEYSFEVQDGKILVNGAETDMIQISFPNSHIISGVASMDGSPVSQGQVHILSKSDPTQWYETDILNGRFNQPLPDGEYTFVGVEMGADTVVVNQSFFVVNGRLIVDMKYKSQLEVVIPPQNLQLKINGVDSTVQNTHISFKPVNSNGYYLGLYSDDAANFRLADGEYEIFKVVMDAETYNLSLKFEVKNGKLLQNGVEVPEVTIDVTPITFKGLIKNADGTPIANADIQVISQSTLEEFVATSDDAGRYDFRLKDGNYTLTRYVLNDSIEAFSSNMTFTISNGKLFINSQEAEQYNITVPNITVRGVLYDGGKPLANSYITVIQGNPFTIRRLYTNQNGVFVGRLPDGYYSIQGFTTNDYQDSGELRLSFQISGGKTYIGGVQKAQIDLQCPSKSFNIILKNGDKPLADIYMNINIKNDPTRAYSKTTNSEGEISLRIPDGEYYIESVYSKELGMIPINRTITVSNGKTNPNPIVIDVSLPIPLNGNFKGIVTDGEKGFAFAKIGYVKSPIYDETPTNSAGEFGVDLEDGQYTIERIENANDEDFYVHIVFEIKGGKLFVDGVQKESITITLTPMTLKGTVTDGQNAITGAKVVVYRADRFSSKGMETDSEGRFTNRLEDGEYFIDTVTYNGYTKYFNTYFSIMNHKMYQNGVEISNLELKVTPIVPFSLKGSVTMGEVLLPSATVNISSTSAIYTNSQGQFQSRLADGNYTIRSIEVSNKNIHFPINKEFSIRDGKMMVNGEVIKSLDLNIPQETLLGIVKSGQDIAKQANVQIRNMENDDRYDATTNEKGEFNNVLPDGNYLVTNISYNLGFYQIYQSFTIQNGRLVGEPLAIDVKKPVVKTVVKGTFTDNGAPVSNGTLFFKKESNTVNISTNAKGEFSFESLDGAYTLLYYWSSSNSYDVHLWKIGFMVYNGKIIMNGQTVDSLNLKVPPVTTAIQIVDKGVPLANQFVTLDFDGDYSIINTSTDKNGKVYVKLPKGKRIIKNVRLFLKNIHVLNMNELIEVENESIITDYVLDLSSSYFLKGNAKGKVEDENGVPIGRFASISYTDLQTGQTNWLKTNTVGEFSFNLTYGSYQINSILMGETGGQSYLALNVPFRYENGKFLVNGVESEILKIVPPQVNVKGSLVDSNGLPLGNIEIPTVGPDRTYYISTNQSGEFELRLPDGDFKISEIRLTDGIRKMDIQYSIKQGKLIVDGVEKQSLVIKIPQINLTGKVTLNGSPVSNGTMEIKQKTSSGDYVKKLVATTDLQGMFKESLPDGEYTITNTQSYNTGKAYIGWDFSLVNGIIYRNGIALNELNITLPQTTVTGRLMLYGQPAGGFNLKFYRSDNGHFDEVEAYVSTTTGDFTARLADGEYSLTTVVYKDQTYTVNKTFKVIRGAISTSPFVVELSGASYTATVNGQVLDNEAIPGAGTIGVINKYYPTSPINFNFKENGEFNGQLPDGAYEVCIVNIKGKNENVLFGLFSFEIKSGELFVKGQSAPILTVNLPKEVSGVIALSGAGIGGYLQVQDSNYASNYLYADSNGQFKMRLADGNYRIYSVNYNQKNYYPNLYFEVKNGTILINNVEKSLLEINIP